MQIPYTDWYCRENYATQDAQEKEHCLQGRHKYMYIHEKITGISDN
jgi:hypothetical protein